MKKTVKIGFITAILFQGGGVHADLSDFQVNINSKENNYSFQTNPNGTCSESTPIECHWYNVPTGQDMTLTVQDPTGNTCTFAAKNTHNGPTPLQKTGGTKCDFFNKIDGPSGTSPITTIYIK